MDNEYKLKQQNILYIEDDIATLNSFSSTLELIVNKLYTAQNGKEALYIIENNKIDIIISDIEMPQMNGIELIHKLKEKNIDIPFIFLTAYSNTQYLLEAVNNNVSKYLIKPINVEELIETLESIAQKIYNKNIINLSNGIEIDLVQNIIIDGNNTLDITANELIFLKLLNNNSNLVSEDELLLKIWNDNSDTRKDSLYSLVTKLRKKIGKTSILNISKIGYRLV